VKRSGSIGGNLMLYYYTFKGFITFGRWFVNNIKSYNI